VFVVAATFIVASGCALQTQSDAEYPDDVDVDAIIALIESRAGRTRSPGSTHVVLTDAMGNEIEDEAKLDAALRAFAPYLIPGGEMPQSIGMADPSYCGTRAPANETHQDPYEHTSDWKYSGEVISFLRYYAPPDGGERGYYYFTYKVYYCEGAGYQCTEVGYDLVSIIPR